MKILHLINYYQPKIGYQEYFLAKKQIELGHDVFFITSDRYFPFSNYKESYEPLLGKRKINSGKFIEYGATVFRLKPLVEISPSFIKNPFIIIRGVNKKIKKIDPDLIVCHGTTIPLSVQLAKHKFLNKKPFIIYDDHQGYPSQKKIIFHKIYGFIFSTFFKKLILKSQDRIIAVSDHTKEFLKEIYGLDDSIISVAPVGVDTKTFYYSEESRKNIRKKLKLGDDDVVSIYTGKLSAYKGINEIIDAHLELRKLYKNYFQIFIGFSQDKKIIERLKSINSIILIDSVSNDHLYKYLSASDFGIWPSHVTISHYEAMACKLPIIVSDLDVAKERVKWDNGFSLNELSSESIFNACVKLIDEKDLRLTMGINSLNAVKKELSWDTIVNSFLA